MSRVTKPIFDHAQLKFSNQLLIFMNLYQDVKNETILPLCFGNIIDLKIGWLRAFWYISQGPD